MDEQASGRGAVLERLKTRFQQTAEDLSLARAQNSELEKRIGSLTETILAANEDKEAIKVESRAELARREEAALADRRRHQDALCAARQQQQRCQMDRDLAIEELTTLRSQVKELQMEKVGMARQVRDLESEVKARCRLQQSASDQMIRHNAAKHKLSKEVAALSAWLRRLEAEVTAAGQLNSRLSLQLQHHQLRQQQPAAAPAESDVVAACAELEELGSLLCGGDGCGVPMTPADPSAPEPPDGKGEKEPVTLSRRDKDTGVSSTGHQPPNTAVKLSLSGAVAVEELREGLSPTAPL